MFLLVLFLVGLLPLLPLPRSLPPFLSAHFCCLFWEVQMRAASVIVFFPFLSLFPLFLSLVVFVLIPSRLSPSLIPIIIIFCWCKRRESCSNFLLSFPCSFFFHVCFHSLSLFTFHSFLSHLLFISF